MMSFKTDMPLTAFSQIKPEDILRTVINNLIEAGLLPT